jgi:hypothetical protein
LSAPGRNTPGIAGGNHPTIVGNLVEDQPLQLHVELGDLLGEPQPATGDRPQREPGRIVGVAGPWSGRSRAAVATRSASCRPRSWARSPSGAVTSSALSRLAVGAGLDRRAARQVRRADHLHLAVGGLGVPVAVPACTARAAAWACRVSGLPWRRRAARSGRDLLNGLARGRAANARARRRSCRCPPRRSGPRVPAWSPRQAAQRSRQGW